MDLPEVQASRRLEATVPLGDSEFPERLPVDYRHGDPPGGLDRAAGRDNPGRAYGAPIVASCVTA